LEREVDPLTAVAVFACIVFALVFLYVRDDGGPVDPER
jgi:hypothetical protein